MSQTNAFTVRKTLQNKRYKTAASGAYFRLYVSKFSRYTEHYFMTGHHLWH